MLRARAAPRDGPAIGRLRSTASSTAPPSPPPASATAATSAVPPVAQGSLERTAQGSSDPQSTEQTTLARQLPSAAAHAQQPNRGAAAIATLPPVSAAVSPQSSEQSSGQSGAQQGPGAGRNTAAGAPTVKSEQSQAASSTASAARSEGPTKLSKSAKKR